MKRIVNHYQGAIKTTLADGGFDFTSFKPLENGNIEICGYVGGPYASTGVWLYTDIRGNLINAQHGIHSDISYTDKFDRSKVKKFVEFYVTEFDLQEILSEETQTGMVTLTFEETEKLRSFAKTL